MKSGKKVLDGVGTHGLKICSEYCPTSRTTKGKEYCKVCGEELWVYRNSRRFCPSGKH